MKPLAAPIDIPRKKRGGRRVRRMKERYAITELRKQQNRMTFGEIEEDAYQDDLGFSAGQAGKKGVAGRIRTAQVDEKTKVRISKTLHKNLQRQQVYGGATTVRRHVSGKQLKIRQYRIVVSMSITTEQLRQAFVFAAK